MAMSDRYIGYTLLRLLADAGLTQSDLANRCKTERMNVSYLCTGKKRMPRLEQAHDYAAVLGISLDVLWYECEKDWKTDSYARWKRLADERYNRGTYEEADAGLEEPRQQDYRFYEEGILVAGEGVEPPTQGFSVSRKQKCPRASFEAFCLREAA